MKKSTWIGLAGVSLLATIIFLCWQWSVRRAAREAKPPGAAGGQPARRPEIDPKKRVGMRAPEPLAPKTLSAAEKKARIDKIKQDYDEVRAKASADYTAAGNSYPGGLNAFLRQLALLEREKRVDFAAVLSPAELEDLEMSETTAGHLVDRLLGPTMATEEQRRKVFRLQRDFEDRFALTLDLTPRPLFERETARQQVQQQIRAVLGDDLFGSWLMGEGEDYALSVAFAARQGLPATVPLDLWQVRNDFTRQRLELNAVPGMSPGQLRAAVTTLNQQTEARVNAILGPVAAQAGRAEILGWLPKR